MNGNALHDGPVTGAQTRPESACDAAYNDLCAAQKEHAVALQKLQGLLKPVMRDHVPSIADAKNAASPAGVLIQSEIHGRFVAATDRVREDTAYVLDAIHRLTI